MEWAIGVYFLSNECLANKSIGINQCNFINIYQYFNNAFEILKIVCLERSTVHITETNVGPEGNARGSLLKR